LTHRGTTLSPSVREAKSASFHLRTAYQVSYDETICITGAYRSTQRHHLQPSFSPGKPPRRVVRSLPVTSSAALRSDCIRLPRSLLNWNSVVTTPPMKCFPASMSLPQQYPSRKNPVGCVESPSLVCCCSGPLRTASQCESWPAPTVCLACLERHCGCRPYLRERRG
jgi:hypothetical protein